MIRPADETNRQCGMFPSHERTALLFVAWPQSVGALLHTLEQSGPDCLAGMRISRRHRIQRTAREHKHLAVGDALNGRVCTHLHTTSAVRGRMMKDRGRVCCDCSFAQGGFALMRYCCCCSDGRQRERGVYRSERAPWTSDAPAMNPVPPRRLHLKNVHGPRLRTNVHRRNHYW
eukprot:2221764-Prymnesium_polylepis.2